MEASSHEPNTSHVYNHILKTFLQDWGSVKAAGDVAELCVRAAVKQLFSFVSDIWGRALWRAEALAPRPQRK